MVTDFKTSSGKDSELFDILYTHFGKTINLSRLKFMAKMMVALVTLRTRQLREALHGLLR